MRIAYAIFLAVGSFGPKALRCPTDRIGKGVTIITLNNIINRRLENGYPKDTMPITIPLVTMPRNAKENGSSPEHWAISFEAACAMVDPNNSTQVEKLVIQLIQLGVADPMCTDSLDNALARCSDLTEEGQRRYNRRIFQALAWNGLLKVVHQHLCNTDGEYMAEQYEEQFFAFLDLTTNDWI